MTQGFTRTVSHYAFRADWMRTKMVFLAGPRQIGKTFIAQKFLVQNSSPKLYYNWDIAETTERFRVDPVFFESDARNIGIRRPTIVFDEIHKRSRWKNELKGIYDRYISDFNFIITGSAKLDLLRRTGESLAGRYFLYRVLPLGLQEYTGGINWKFDFKTFKDLIETLNRVTVQPKALKTLLLMGGFPDPLLRDQYDYRLKWAVDYRRMVLREDLRDLSRIQEIDRVETLWSLLPERVGSPLSVQALREDLHASHEGVSTWLLNLEKLYSIFFVQPYSKKVARSVKKEKKVYLMDWALLSDEAKRFENFVLSSLYRSTCIWSDSGQGVFELYFIRNVLKQEADFLIVRNGKPWMLGDVKLASRSIDSHLFRMAAQLGNIPVIQIVRESGIFKTIESQGLIISADRFFMVFP